MKNQLSHNSQYIGRFAPSPTGPLHFGSLVAALASYLDARANQGRWLVRMEDIDPPRAQPGADRSILEALEAHGLEWDGEVLLQSTRSGAYQRVIDRLIESDTAFYCNCSRQQLKQQPVYPGTCRQRRIADRENCAVRIKVEPLEIRFLDEIQGEQSQRMDRDIGDFVIFRRDGFFAYMLAVALDDAFQNISKVVRGCDLLDSTARQIYLLKTLNLSVPEYCHLPVIVNQVGQKLSKQNLAQPLQDKQSSRNLYRALIALGQNPLRELEGATTEEILGWGIANWNMDLVPRSSGIPLSEIEPNI